MSWKVWCNSTNGLNIENLCVVTVFSKRLLNVGFLWNYYFWSYLIEIALEQPRKLQEAIGHWLKSVDFDKKKGNVSKNNKTGQVICICL